MTNKQQLVMSIVACALAFSPMANAQNKTAIKLLPKPHALKARQTGWCAMQSS